MPAKSSRPPPEECANCGAEIPRSAKACPECGADERTGWRETDGSIYYGLDLPDEDGEGEAPPRGGRSGGSSRDVNGIAWYWWCVGIALVLALVLGALGLR